jgi:hypothetical protein
MLGRLRNERHQHSKSTGLGMLKNINITQGPGMPPSVRSSCAVHKASNPCGLAIVEGIVTRVYKKLDLVDDWKDCHGRSVAGTVWCRNSPQGSRYRGHSPSASSHRDLLVQITTRINWPVVVSCGWSHNMPRFRQHVDAAHQWTHRESWLSQS